MTRIKQQASAKAGFTLVELSIVLVIIGLIVASVLVGQDLVKQAEIRSTISQYEQFQAAVKTFQAKYSAFPGDVNGAATYGWDVDGDNDGQYLDAAVAGTGANDNTAFWNHLGAGGAALISGSYAGAEVLADGSNIAANLPSADVGEYWGVFSDASYNYYVLGVTTPGLDGEFDTKLVLTPVEGLSFDTKIDDGRPGRGSVLSRDILNNDDATPGSGTGIEDSATTAAGAGDNCAYANMSGTGTYVDSNYNTAEPDPSCSFRIRM